ncbi:DIA2 [Candida margitis]|uniref:DIA2 n=1 Tax=Candida margitis TaxID=1775924 RepID=UPI00222615B9|nr:DIA2 [Candida margitis]KAI5967346.1 DIA2 [Candida margitis]
MLDEQLIHDRSKLAVLYFKSGDYVKALSIYDKLIYQVRQFSSQDIKAIRAQYGLKEIPEVGKLIHPKLTTYLDQRAATLEKLEKYDSALRDSIRSIELDPSDYKGYLRIGKLHMMEGNKYEAYKTYQRGLYVIESLIKKGTHTANAKLYDKLKEQYRLLNQELKAERKASDALQSASASASTSRLGSTKSHTPVKKRRVTRDIDPTNYLPLECLNLIFHHLSPQTIYKCRMVSKSWYSALMQLKLYHFDCKPIITLDEFTQGVKFFKKNASHTYSKQIKRLKINQVYNKKLPHVLSVLIKEPQFPIQSFEVMDPMMNLQLIYASMAKYSWKLNNFHHLQSLSLGINCSIKYPQLLLNMFPQLKHLKICIMIPDRSVMNMVPLQDKVFKKFKSLRMDSYKLETLFLVNHVKLLTSESMTISPTTYNPCPVLLDYNFPNLTELTMCSFNFSNHLPTFGEFLTRHSNITKLYLENNPGLNLLIFLQILLNYKPGFQLTHFTFREHGVASTMSLQEIYFPYITQFSHMEQLDLYKTCLSVIGLEKILTTCGKSLKYLNLGCPTYLSFHIPGRKQLELNKILSVCPELSHLLLPDMNIDTVSMMNIIKQLQSIQQPVGLHYLDLGFNQFDGVDLMRLLGTGLRLDTLDVNGLSISEDTLVYIKRKGFVQNILFDQRKTKWKVYGVNTWLQQ